MNLTFSQPTSENLESQDTSEKNQIKQIKKQVLTIFFEQADNGRILVRKIRESLDTESSELIMVALKELMDEKLIEMNADGRELELKLTLRAALKLAFGNWPWE